MFTFNWKNWEGVKTMAENAEYERKRYLETHPADPHLIQQLIEKGRPDDR